MHARTSLMSTAMILALAPGAAAQVATFTDTEFLDADWSHAAIMDTGGGSTWSAAHCSSGGNPGACQCGTLTFAKTWVVLAHWLNAAVYDPSVQGALDHIDLRMDVMCSAGSGICGPIPGDPAIAADILVTQGSNHFTTPVFLIAIKSGGWRCLGRRVKDTDLGLIANGKIDMTVHPDFSAAGGPLTLGYLSSNSTGASSCHREWLADNFSMQLFARGGIGTIYCSPNANNSTKQPARIWAFGSVLVADDELRLEATDLPNKMNGYFLVSQGMGVVPNPGGSDGTLCLAGSKIGRFRAQIRNSGECGKFRISVDLTSLPMGPPQAVLPGETWNFQGWYRDGSTSNFTDAVSITFL